MFICNGANTNILNKPKKPEMDESSAAESDLEEQMYDLTSKVYRKCPFLESEADDEEIDYDIKFVSEKKIVTEDPYRSSGRLGDLERPKQVSKKRSANIEEMNEQRNGGGFSSSGDANYATTFNCLSDDELVPAPTKISGRTTAENDAAESDKILPVRASKINRPIAEYKSYEILTAA